MTAIPARQVSFRLPVALVALIDKRAVKIGVSRNEFVEKLLCDSQGVEYVHRPPGPPITNGKRVRTESQKAAMRRGGK